ncbi:MAG: hypothetical protein GWP19_13480 [Planctomycetia bacterium]|nr:hypothetical protein [Planctomycetia bacterium]
MKQPFLLYLLIVLVFFQALSGLAGGFGLTLSPSGESIQMPISMLENTPFNNFLIPGLFLLLVLGVFPTLLGYAMLKEPNWNWANKLNVYKKYHFLWAYSLYLGLILILWINIEIYMVGGGHILQFIYGILGTLLIIITLSPQVMNYYEKLAAKLFKNVK